MASDSIPITPGAKGANLLNQYKDACAALYALGLRIRDTMNHQFVSTDFATTVEPYWGIPSGQGQTVFTLVDGSVNSMTGGATGSYILDVSRRLT